VFALLIVSAIGCSKQSPAPVIDDSLRALSAQPTAESQACAKCHQAIYDEWVGSQHANANRLVSDEKDRAAFDPATDIQHGSFITSMRRSGKDEYTFSTSFSNQPPETFHAEAVIGITPLLQYLVPYPGGRLQVMDISYDPRSNEWFNAFGDENRQPHEWGHWRGRSMTWNVQCAFCHMTGFEKKYDIKEDRYNSTWKAMGISCSQCHVLKAESLEEVSGVGVRSSGKTNECPMIASPPPEHRTLNTEHPTPNASMENCASCHARREELFGTFKPGDSFHDHFRLTLPDQPGIFHADGQVREEDFEYASFMMSRMGHKGVTCLDCHNPHSGKLKAPVENNQLCMTCHTPPGINGAVAIDPVGHSFHKPGVPGSKCVDCHMPVNTYMQRDGRRDHGFTSPDPLLTIEHGIPNACNRCHTDQTPQWANEWTQKWYGDKMNRRTRDRARVVARYHAGDETVGPELIAMAAGEEIDAWRAALVGMIQAGPDDAMVQEFLQREVSHPSPLVRSAAIRSLQQADNLLLSDTSALVRVDATMVHLENNRPVAPPNFAELKAYIDNISDQPAGAMRQMNLAIIKNRPADAEMWARKALAWDPSAVPHYTLGRVLHQNGKLLEAISNLTAAAFMDEENAEYSFTLALAIAEAGNNNLALKWLENTVRRDRTFGRAWYNLGLAYSQVNRIDEASKALREAENNMPESADPAYARATILLKFNDQDKAVAALQAALRKDPQHAPSLEMLRQLSPHPSTSLGTGRGDATK